MTVITKEKKVERDIHMTECYIPIHTPRTVSTSPKRLVCVYFFFHFFFTTSKTNSPFFCTYKICYHLFSVFFPKEIFIARKAAAMIPLPFSVRVCVFFSVDTIDSKVLWKIYVE